MTNSKDKICKNCGHTKKCHTDSISGGCLHLNEPFTIPEPKNICGCKDFQTNKYKIALTSEGEEVFVKKALGDGNYGEEVSFNTRTEAEEYLKEQEKSSSDFDTSAFDFEIKEVQTND